MNTVTDKKFKHFAELLEDVFMTVTFAEADDLADLRKTSDKTGESDRLKGGRYGDGGLCGYGS
ncbi:MAG: hypothetical protein AB1499_01035 [Nitrospirota bacterium]